MFESVEMAPPDPILGLTEAFKADPNPEKINLGVGVYKDSSGKTPVLRCIAEAGKRLVADVSDAGYLPITGSPEYGKAVRHLLFGGASELVSGGRAFTAHTPGGTGALRVAADFFHVCQPNATLWLSDPTWANHHGVFNAAGVATSKYPYFDAASNALDFDAMLATLKSISAGDVVLLHGCCHNPTGVDPTPQQWVAIADVLAERHITPVIDQAYQGFGDGLEKDVTGLRTLVAKLPEVIVCSSFSKNFGMYRQRVGAITCVAQTPDVAKTVESQVKLRIRTNYSNPPAFGGACVATVLADAELTAMWHDELTEMRTRINSMRQQFTERLAEKASGHDFGFIMKQRGMFSMSGLSKDQVRRLREEHAIYVVGSGRINVAGMTESNLGRLCDAITAVL